MISKVSPTNYLLITYGKTVILQWRNFMDTTLSKWPKSMPSAMGQANSMRWRAQHHLEISIKKFRIQSNCKKMSVKSKWRNTLACNLWKWTGEQTQRLENVPAKKGETIKCRCSWSEPWNGKSSALYKGYWGELWKSSVD